MEVVHFQITIEEWTFKHKKTWGRRKKNISWSHKCNAIKTMLLSIDKREDNVKLKNMRQGLFVYGMENMLKVKKDGMLRRALCTSQSLFSLLFPGQEKI